MKSKVPTLILHPYCEMFPLMNGQEWATLRDSIAKNGVREPIVVLVEAGNITRPIEQCPIIDGRHRYEICKELDIEPPFLRKFFESDEALLSYVLDRNLHRRQLTIGQWAAVAAKSRDIFSEQAKARQTAALKQNTDSADLRERDGETGKATEQLAERFPVSARTIESAVAAKEKGVPELFVYLEQGKIAASLAEQVAKLTVPSQHEFLSRISQGEKPAEVYAELKREAESARIVSELLDAPTTESQGSQSEETPITQAITQVTPPVPVPAMPWVPLSEFVSVNGMVSLDCIMQLSHNQSAPNTGTIRTPLRIDGKLWVCIRLYRNRDTGEDRAECVRLRAVARYVSDFSGKPDCQPPLSLEEWQAQVTAGSRDKNDFAYLTVDTNPYWAQCICLPETAMFVHRQEQVAAPIADDEAADPHFAEQDEAVAPSGLRSVYRTEKEKRAELVAATTLTDESPMIVFDYMQALDLRFRNFLLEPDIPADFFSRFISLTDYDFPTCWENILLNMARRIIILEAVENGQAVPVSAKSLHLLKLMAERWTERNSVPITVEDYLSMMIDQKAEQAGINTDEVIA